MCANFRRATRIEEVYLILRRVALCGLIALAAGLLPASWLQPPVTPAIDKAEAMRRLRAMPLAFEENRGQTATAAAFVARGQGYAMWATAEGPILRLGNRDAAATFRLRAVGGAKRSAVAEAPLGGRANYFKGNDPSRWITNVPRYGALRYAGVYDGIDLVLHGTQQSLEYDFEVRPHADPSRIAVMFDGAEDIRVEDDGDLTIAASGSELRFHKPVAFQHGANGREPIEARYELAENGEVRFALGEYDRTRALVIDPVIEYSTYLSGTLRWNGAATAAPSSDDAYGLTVDAAGNAYLTGFTNAIDFPMAGAGFDTTCSGCFSSGGDAFVAKIDPSQSGAASLVFTTYLGALGPGSSGGNAVAVDASGAVHVTGWTNGYDQVSTPANEAFPVTPSALQPNDGGDLAVLDGFFVKLDPNGSTLLYSTYLGSNNVDEGYGVRVDAAGFTYVAGRTAGGNFAPIKNGFQTAHASPGLSDAFVVKIDTLATGPASLVYGSFYGGTGNDHVESLAIDAQGRAYIAGDSNSVGNTLPMKNGFLPVTTPGQHAFVAVLDPSLSGAPSLYYSTYIGTSGTQGATFREGGIAVDANGIVFMTGSHFSGTFATTPGAYRSTVQGSEAFIVKIDPSQVGAPSLVAATLLGGSFNEVPNALTLDGGGNPIVAGWTQSSDFPVTECGLPKKNSTDAFVTALNKNLTGLLYSSILGGFGNDFGNEVAVGPTAIYLAGGSDSLDYPTTPNAFDPTHNGSINGSGAREAFLTVIGNPYDRCPTPPSAIGSNEATPEDTPKPIVLKATDVGGHSTPPDELTWTITQAPTKGSLDVSNGAMTHGAGSAYSVNVVYTPNPNAFGADSFKFQVNDGTLNSNIATVNITITAINDAPTANAQGVQTSEGTPTAPIILTAVDPENNVPLTFAIAQLPANGELAGAGNSYVYTPNAGFSGVDEFSFTAKDSLNAVSAPAIVSITVVPGNEAPDAVNDAVTTAEDTPVTVAVLANDIDADGDALTLKEASCNSGSSWTINADGTLEVSPAPNYHGSILCAYGIEDTQGATAFANIDVTVTPVNDAPVIVNDVATTPEDTPVTVDVLANDTDVDGDTLGIFSWNCGPHLATLTPDHQIHTEPAANFHGVIACQYQAMDHNGAFVFGSLTITVTPVNDKPVAHNDDASTPEDQPVTIPVLMNDTDVDGDVLALKEAACNAGSSWTINADGTLKVTPAANYHGPILCAYGIEDTQGATAFANVNVAVTPVNDKPVAADDSATAMEDTPVTVAVLANDTDVDGNALGVVWWACGPYAVSLTDNHELHVQPPANFHGDISCLYQTTDHQGGFDEGLLTVTVTPVNDAPSVNDPGDQETEPGEFVTLPITGSDVDGDALTFQAIGLPPGITMSPAGMISGSAATQGSYQVTVTADDGNGGTASVTFGWTVTKDKKPKKEKPRKK